MAKYRLISFNLCPYVQRSVITLEQKGIPYDIDFIDLSNRPDWFSELSPLGKVPVLVVDDDTVLFESAVINEYLDECTGPGHLLPSNPLAKARHRSWVEFSSAALVDAFRMMMSPDKESCFELAKTVRSRFARFEKELTSAPFFAGSELSLVDTAAAPLLQRLVWTEKVVPELKLFEQTPKVKRWTDNLLALESVKNSTVEGLEGIHLEYLQGRGSPTRKAPSSWIGTQVQA